MMVEEGDCGVTRIYTASAKIENHVVHGVVGLEVYVWHELVHEVFMGGGGLDPDRFTLSAPIRSSTPPFRLR